MNLRTDPRVEPHLLAALAAFGRDAPAGPPVIDRRVPLQRPIENVVEQRAGFNSFYEALPNALPGDDVINVTHKPTITGADSNAIMLRIYRSAAVNGPLPCTLYIHGGGMVILDSFNKVYRRWCDDLAATGMVVIGVDLHNA